CLVEQRIDGSPRVRRIRVRVDDTCRPRAQALDEITLGVDPGCRIVLGIATADKALALDGGLAAHEPHLVAELSETAFDELDRLDHDGPRPCPLRSLDGRQDARPD